LGELYKSSEHFLEYIMHIIP